MPEYDIDNFDEIENEWETPLAKTHHPKRKSDFDYKDLEILSETPVTPANGVYSYHADRASRWWSAMTTRKQRKKRNVVQSFECQDSADFADENVDSFGDQDFNDTFNDVDVKPGMNFSFKTDACTQTDDHQAKINKKSSKTPTNWGFEISCFFVACFYTVMINWLIVYPWLQSGKE